MEDKKQKLLTKHYNKINPNSFTINKSLNFFQPIHNTEYN